MATEQKSQKNRTQQKQAKRVEEQGIENGAAVSQHAFSYQWLLKTKQGDIIKSFDKKPAGGLIGAILEAGGRPHVDCASSDNVAFVNKNGLIYWTDTFDNLSLIQLYKGHPITATVFQDGEKLLWWMWRRALCDNTEE